jgi:hypothetical protein
MTAAVGEEMPLGDQQPRARRRFAAYAGLIAAVLLLAGVVLSRHPGTNALGVVTFGYGLGVAIAAILLGFGWEPRRRRK